VLKRIRTTPLPAGAYVTGHIISTVVTTLAIAACMGVAGWLAFGTAPRLNGLFLLTVGLALGIVCFAALGLAVGSGIFDPTIGLRASCPARRAYCRSRPWPRCWRTPTPRAGTRSPAPALGILLAWAVAGAALAAWRFRRQPA
jgi:hypothetical protein